VDLGAENYASSKYDYSKFQCGFVIQHALSQNIKRSGKICKQVFFVNALHAKKYGENIKPFINTFFARSKESISPVRCNDERRA